MFYRFYMDTINAWILPTVLDCIISGVEVGGWVGGPCVHYPQNCQHSFFCKYCSGGSSANGLQNFFHACYLKHSNSNGQFNDDM